MERPLGPEHPTSPLGEDRIRNLKATLEEFDAKIGFLKEEALQKKGLIFRSKTNAALSKVRLYEEKDKTQLPLQLVNGLRAFFDLLCTEEIRTRKNEIRGRLLAESSNACDKTVREFAGVFDVEIWLPAVFSLLQVVLS